MQTSLVRTAQCGDRDALDQLLARVMPGVRSLVGRALNGHADADDVVQEVLIQIVRGLPRLRDPERFRAWAVAITNRQIQLYLRTRRRDAPRRQELAEDLPDPGLDFAERTAEDLVLTGQRQEVAEAARWLDDDERALLAVWWREAAVRHTRNCSRCTAHSAGLIAPERLLPGLVALLAGLKALSGKHAAAAVATAAVLIGFALTFPVTTPRDLFVAPDGDDGGDGSKDRPLATVGAAADRVRPGRTIWLRGGTYALTTPIELRTGGTTDARITLAGYGDERPVLDGSGLPADAWVVTHEADYWTVRDLEIRGARSNAYVCLSCKHDTFLRLSIHGGYRAALQLRGDGTDGNQILDGDFYANRDPAPGTQNGQGIALKFGGGAGNVLRGNRVWSNADNGIDLGEFNGAVTLERNWAWSNGANGFAVGGGSPAPAAGHVLRTNLAWDNGGAGFQDDGNPGPLRLTGNTAWRNRTAGFALTADTARLDGNRAVGNAKPATRTWSAAELATQAAFRSTDPATAQGARQADGTLPVTDFLTTS
ncbi:sigma-70 family RNA polymerase sigma factor [Dactylosporangium sp. NPDC051541]|uniref:sigma-70 family RNA polymerase sigma factor n=1 Tax=Dactylosporangium sp. NPDC051541 TaxID=3363977 RepID=UPI0037A4BF1C